MDRIPMIDAAGIADLRQTYADGMQTLQEWSGDPVLTFTRTGGGGAGAVTCISVKMADRQTTTTGAGQPLMTTERTGEIKLFADQIPSGKTIRPGDRFIWNNLPNVVQAAPIEQIEDTGVLRIPFVIEDQV